ncbi:MAG: hypothetical protein IT364_27770, partial [Candidatus Hydrogenedentes bacterium]|nr:hypothetical protein [Candidatus Hydrogenedentota bacterium]
PLIVKLQIAAMAIFTVLLFASVTTASLHETLLGGFLGVNAVLVHSVLLAFVAVQYTWLRNSSFYAPLLKGKAPGSTSRATRWARFVFLCMFLITLNVFVTSLRGYTHWGVVSGHDSPQYYAWLHSWVFDRDINFENELKAIPGVWELMSTAHPERPEYNVAPIGTAVVWLPFYLAAHVVLLLLNGMGYAVPTDGLASPYAMACAFGSNFVVLLGMLMIHASLRARFSERASFFATVLLWVASPLIWFMTDQPWMSHACSFFAAALVFWLWMRRREQRTLPGWIALGAAIGLAMLVRPTHAVLLILPVLDAAAGIRAKGRPAAYGGLAILALASALLVFSWQLVTWWLRTGAGTPPGSPMQWTSPAISPVLFSAHHGLFPWHPVMLAGFLGVPILWRRARYDAFCLLLLLAGYVYFNAAIESWWGGGSFGMRRFVEALPFMAPGIAAFGVWCVSICRKRPAVPAAVFTIVFCVYNSILVVQFREGWSDFLRPLSFQQVWSSTVTIFHDTFGNPFTYPASLWFAAKHDVSPAQYDVAMGVPPDAELDVQGMPLRSYLGKGWRGSFRFAAILKGAYPAEENESELFIYCRKGHAYKIGLSMSLPNEMQEDQPVEFLFNGQALGAAVLEKGARSELTISVPGEITNEGLNILTLRFANRIAKVREGTYGEGGGYGLEMKTRFAYPACALLWRLRVATDYGDAPPATDEASAPVNPSNSDRTSTSPGAKPE